MEKEVIDLEEYKAGHYRAKTAKKGWQREPEPEAECSAEQAGSGKMRTYVRAFLNLTRYDCLTVVATMGLLSRIIMLLCYLITARLVEYNRTLNFWYYVGQIFWIVVDAHLLQSWHNIPRQFISQYRSRPSNRIAVKTALVIAMLVSGVAFIFAIAKGWLSQFITLNHFMVMGSMAAMIGSAAFCLWRIIRLIVLWDDDEVMTLDQALRQFSE